MLLPTVCCLLVAGALAGPAQRASTLQTKTLEQWATLEEDLFSNLKSPSPAADLSALSDASARGLSPDFYVLEPGLYIVKSPRFPLRYPNNQNVNWVMTADAGQDLSVDCLYDIQASSACAFDSLFVNGDVRCGIGAISVTFASIDIALVSDGSVRRRGFFCVVTVPKGNGGVATRYNTSP